MFKEHNDCEFKHSEVRKCQNEGYLCKVPFVFLPTPTPNYTEHSSAITKSLHQDLFPISVKFIHARSSHAQYIHATV